MNDYSNLSNILTKGLQSSLATTEIGEGILRFTTDTGKLFLDTSNSRIPITDVVTGMTDSQIKSLNNPSSVKLYVASDTFRIYTYDSTNDEMIDVSTIIPVETTTSANVYIWMGFKDTGHPLVSADLTYNPGTKTLRAGGMKVTETEDSSTPILNFFMNDDMDFGDIDNQEIIGSLDDADYDFGDIEGNS